MQPQDRSPQRVIFVDARHIRCGDIGWVSSDGRRWPVHPEGSPVEVRPDFGLVPYGIRLQAQPATKTERVPGLPRLVVFDQGVYRSWQLEAPRTAGGPPGSVTIRHLQSENGFDWAETATSTIQVPGQYGFDGLGFFVDPHGAPSERYKLVYSARAPRERWPELLEAYERLHPRYRDGRIGDLKGAICIWAAVSSDGLHWQAVPEPLMVHMSDTDTTVTYNEWLGRYVMYTRLYDQERRGIGRAEAEDFWHWGPVQPLISARLDGPLSDDIYLNSYTRYPGAPAYHLMFPMIYHRLDQSSEIRLYASADGILWSEVPGGPVIQPGGPNDWDGAFLAGGKNLVPLGRDQVALPYAGTPYPHKYPRWPEVVEATGCAWACWPEGRLCAVVADEVGEFATFPLIPRGRQLRLNVRVRRGGEVRVGLYHEGRSVEGRSANECASLYGDDLCLPVHWNGQTDIAVPKGQAVVLHFRLRAAQLFGFEWVG